MTRFNPARVEMQDWKRGILVCAAVLLAIPSLLQAQASSFYDAPPHLRPGDVISVQVWRQADYSGEFEVTSEGTIGHPLYREIQVAGRSLDQVEEAIRSFLLTFVEEPAFVVEIFFQVSVSGQVRSPDVYPLRPETSVARAVALAGGPTDRGDLTRVIIRRNGEAYLLDLQSSDARLRDLEVRSGDEIVVERRSDVFRDYVAPSASVVAALATILSILLR